LQIVDVSFSGSNRNRNNLTEDVGELDRNMLGKKACNPTAIYEELALKLGRTRKTVRVHIKSLRENGLIIRIGLPTAAIGR